MCKREMKRHRVCEGGYHVLNTERQVLVKVVFFLARVGKGDIIKSDDRRRKFTNIFEVESKGTMRNCKRQVGLNENNVPQWFGGLDLFNETGSFHLVDDLLLRFGLANKVGVCTCRSNEPEPKV